VKSLKFTSGYVENLGRISKYVIPTPIGNHANGDTYENLPFLDIDHPRHYTFYQEEGRMIVDLKREGELTAQKNS